MHIELHNTEKIIMQNTDKLKKSDLQLAENLERFRRHKLLLQKLNRKFQSVISNSQKRRRICECGSFLKFNLYQHIETDEQMRSLIGANFCKFRFCPMCSWRKARTLCNEVLQKINSVSEVHNGVAFLFLTLTVKNPPITELNASVKHLNNSFMRMSKIQAFKRAVLGYVRAVEFVGDNTHEGEAHPHFHCLLVVRKSYFKSRDYLNQSHWTEMWKSALRVEYTPLVNVKRIKAKGTLSALQSACLEVVKYAVSFSDMSKMTTDDIKELFKQTRGVRQYALGGEVKTAELSETQVFSEDEWDLIGEELFQWSADNYQRYMIKDKLE